jgi:DNA repair protein RadC
MENRNGPREDIKTKGAYFVSDADLLAIILSPGTKERSAYVLAQKVLKECGGLEGLKCKRVAELEAIPGVGPDKASKILAAVELGRRVSSFTNGNTPLSSPEEVAKYAQIYATEPEEVFVAIGVTTKNKPIGHWVIARGWESGVNLTVRQVFTVLLKEGASRAIFVHNHPSGDLSPSLDDIRFTEKLLSGAQTVDIKVLDHVIVAQNGFTSIRALGRSNMTFAL